MAESGELTDDSPDHPGPSGTSGGSFRAPATVDAVTSGDTTSRDAASRGQATVDAVTSGDATSRDAASRGPALAPAGGTMGRWITGLLATATTGLAGFVLCRLLGLDWFTPVAQVISFIPYLVPVAVVVTVACAVARRWRTALVAGLVVVALTVVVGPRMFGGDSPTPAGGIPLRVMTVNVYQGGSTAELMPLLRQERPDLLSLQEVTGEALDELTAAGLPELLPYQAVRPQPGVAGTALYARAPFTGLRTLHPGTRFDMARAKTVHKGVALDVVAVHPSPPVPVGDATRDWNAELGLLPRPDPDDGVVTVLAGDFNATLDHSRLRAVLDSGYVDAADAVGAGLTPTWQAGWVPPVTIDHVLVERGAEVRAIRVHPVAHSDHRAVVADLVLSTG